MKVVFVVKPFTVELLGIAYIASYLTKLGHTVSMWRLGDETRFPIDSDVAAFSVTTGQHEEMRRFAVNLKRILPKIKTIFGGPHPTFFPSFVFEEGVDIIVRGEGEILMGTVLEQIKNNTLHSAVFGPDKLCDINTLPHPNRKFLYTYHENLSNPIRNVMCSRGCPFSCPYCFNSITHKLVPNYKVRYRKVDDILLECKNLVKKYYTTLIFFQDDEFLSHPYLYKLMYLYKSQVKIPFHCQIRIEKLTPFLANLLKEAGCASITFAVECGNEKYRKDILHRYVSNSAIRYGVRILKENKIPFRIENMVGLPGTTLANDLETIKFNQELQPTYAWSSIFQPYPSLPLSKLAQELGEWDGKVVQTETFFEGTILELPHKKDISRLQKVFATVVRRKVPESLIKFLISVPLNYTEVYKEEKERGYNKLFKEVKKK